jgi:hypothetical protein
VNSRSPQSTSFPTPRRDRLTGRIPSLFAGGASLSLVAALVAAAGRAIEPFEHGIWLVAYLLLVGFLAQLLLGLGQARMLAGVSGEDAPPVGAQAAFWNAGVVAVPLGVLVGTRLLVVLGSVALLTALAAFWRASRRRRSEAVAGSGGVGVAYVALIVIMAVSVFVGTALAWDTPWL